MCGVAGVVNQRGPGDVLEDLLRRMIGAFRYRGPDQSGMYLDHRAGRAHAQFSITGLDDGCQPIGNESGSVWIVFNGEAYNCLELRPELEERGHRFATSSNTEVVLHPYEEFGPRGLERINGQFAIAIWRNVKPELFLDLARIGVRLLFYTLAGGRTLFASEVKSLFQDPAVPRAIARWSLSQVFKCWSTVSPTNVFRGVQEPPPGHFLRVRRGTWSRMSSGGLAETAHRPGRHTAALDRSAMDRVPAWSN